MGLCFCAWSMNGSTMACSAYQGHLEDGHRRRFMSVTFKIKEMVRPY